MTPLVARVVRGLTVHGLAGPGDRVAVAVSGGPDSVALTILLGEALPAVGAALAGIAHLNHGLRGEAADADERFCRTFAGARGLAFDVERVDVRALARARRMSLEAAGHDARYAFYDRARARLGASLMATGHTRNDLAETFLMRALRGAGLRGLGGIRPLNGAVIRPLLDVSRAEVLTFLRERGQGVCDDATNRDPRVFRNRVRHEVLPWLETTLAPRATEALARAARLAADEDEQLERDATGSVHSFVLAEGEGLAFDVAELARLPLALRRRVVIGSAERAGGRPFTAAAVERVLDLVSRGRGQVDVPGVRASIVGARLELRQAPRRRAHERATGDGAFVGELNVPGVVSLPGGGRIEAATSRPVPAHDQGPMTAALDAAAVRAPMLVRFRWTGARFQPLGMSGHKKVQDLFVDRKVPRAQRDKVPLVVDADGGILWVAGHAIADRARVTPATTSVLLLKYLR